MANPVKTVADKYILENGATPDNKPVLVLAEKEVRWIQTAILRSGWMPYQLRDGQNGPWLSELKSMHRRGLVSGPPWRVSAYGREAAANAIAPITQLLPPKPVFVIRTLAQAERELVLAALHHCGGNKTHAAKLLGISVRTMRNKVTEYAVLSREAKP